MENSSVLTIQLLYYFAGGGQRLIDWVSIQTGFNWDTKKILFTLFRIPFSYNAYMFLTLSNETQQKEMIYLNMEYC